MKRFLLLLVILIGIGAGIFILSPQQANNVVSKSPAADNSEAPAAAFFDPSNELARQVIAKVLDTKFDTAKATYTIADLDGKNGPELIIGAVEDIADPLRRPLTATLQVVSLLNETGDYERVGRIDYQEWMRGVPEVKELKDVTGDTQPEIIASLLYGGASSWAEGVLQIDISAKKLEWLQMQNQQGQVQDAVFILAASAAHHNSVEFQDIDADANQELIEIFSQTIFDETECTANVYKWTGTQFTYDANLSQQILDRLNSECILS